MVSSVHDHYSQCDSVYGRDSLIFHEYIYSVVNLCYVVCLALPGQWLQDCAANLEAMGSNPTDTPVFVDYFPRE